MWQLNNTPFIERVFKQSTIQNEPVKRPVALLERILAIFDAFVNSLFSAD